MFGGVGFREGEGVVVLGGFWGLGMGNGEVVGWR